MTSRGFYLGVLLIALLSACSLATSDKAATPNVAQPAPRSGAAPQGMPPGGPPPMPSVSETEYVAAVLVRDGRLDVDRTLVGEQVIDTTEIVNLSVTTERPRTNGLLVIGKDAQVTVSATELDLSGIGENDFLGIGAGVMVAEGQLTVADSRIVTRGATASAAVATDRARLVVRDSVLIAHGGPLPDNYVPRIGPGMMEPPPPLLITGTARTHITMKNAHSYFYNTRIEADGWGALSTDAAGEDAYLEANDCTIIVRNSGYGAYADFGANVVVNGGTMDVATYGLIIAGEAEASFNGLTGRSGGNMVMIHSVMGRPSESGQLKIAGGEFTSAEASILIKSANAEIVVENALLRSNTGVLLRMRKNEDPNATVVGDSVPPGVTLELANGNYNGDVLNDDPERSLTLTLRNATLTGKVRNATVRQDSSSHIIPR